MSLSERAYLLLLRAYPADFRARYGREMLLVFRDLRRDAGIFTAGDWARIVWDVTRSAPPSHVESWRARWGRTSQGGVSVMKPLALAMIVIGALEAVNAIGEGWAGGAGDRIALGAAALGVVAGLALALSGFAVLRGGDRAASRAGLGAAVCLAAFALVAVLRPRLSIAAMALGVLAPLTLLVVLGARRGRRSGASAACVALLVLAIPSRATAQAQGSTSATTAAVATVKDLPLSAAERQTYVGRYDVILPGGMRTVLNVFEQENTLVARPDNQDETHRLVYQGNNVFLVENVPDFSLSFTVEGGRATKFSLLKGDGFGEGVRIP